MASRSVNLTDLRQLIDMAIDRIVIESGNVEFPIDPKKELYWEVAVNELFDMGKKPGEPTVGSLADDANFVGAAARSNPVTIYSLVHAAGLLRYIAEQFSSSNSPKPE